jgi:hypothetical protein
MPRPAVRPRNPAPIQLTDRDYAILETLYAYDGLMARRQIARLFFPGRDDSRVKHRMGDLFKHRYVAQPDESSDHRVAEWVYWLDVKGYHLVAQRAGREATKAELARAKGFRWDTIPHMVAVHDVRLAILEAIRQDARLSLDVWKSAWALNRYRTDRFAWQAPGRPAQQGTYVADGFCLVRQRTPDRDKDRGYAYLLEVDRASESQTVISEEKLRRGYCYLQSPVYRERHGVRFGRFLVVTTGEERMDHMRASAREARIARAFFFTTFARLGFVGGGESWRLEEDIPNALTAPVWLLADSAEPVALIPGPA